MVECMSFLLCLELCGVLFKIMIYLLLVIVIVVILFFGVLLFLVLGKDLLVGLKVFLVDLFNGKCVISELLFKFVLLILCVLGLVVCFCVSIWNIGVEGQFMVGVFCLGVMLVWLDVLGYGIFGGMGLLLMIVVGIIGGVLWVVIMVYLCDQFNVNEILVLLMLIYVVQLLLMWVVNGLLKDFNGMNFLQLKVFFGEFMLFMLMLGMCLYIGFVVVIVVVILMVIFMMCSLCGFLFMVGGVVLYVVCYVGFLVCLVLWVLLLILGVFVGLVGVFEIVGLIGQLLLLVLLGYGFVVIIVVFIGCLYLVGVILGGLIMLLLYLGGELVQLCLGLFLVIMGVFQGMLLFLLLVCDMFIDYCLVWKKKV